VESSRRYGWVRRAAATVRATERWWVKASSEYAGDYRRHSGEPMSVSIMEDKAVSGAKRKWKAEARSVGEGRRGETKANAGW